MASKRLLEQVDVEEDDELAGLDMAPSDAEATIMLLRSKLYPDPAAAAATAAAAKQSRHAKRSKGAAGPSRATAAAVTAAAAAAAAAQQLPPLVFKTQLYTVLTDRTAADRDVEDLRRQGRVRVFKLGMGADEYVLMLTQDYLGIIDRLIDKHRQQHQKQQQVEHPQPQQPGNQQGHSASSDSHGAAIAATLQVFRDRVVPACNTSSISRSRLLELLTAAPQSLTPAAATAVAAPVPAAVTKQPSSIRRTPAPSARAAPSTIGGSAMFERHLLAAEVVTRDSRCPDSYMLTVPGAAAFAKSVLSGRQEILQLLSRKKYQEALENELACVKLRGGCCLTPAFIIKDLQGRGLVTLTDTTAGLLVRLVQRK